MKELINTMNILNNASKIGLLAGILSFSFFSPGSGILVEGSPSTIINDSQQEDLNTKELIYASGETFLTPVNAPSSIQTRKITVTAYSSTPDQTDDSPFITASGKLVCDGIIASNFLPFGTKVRFPKLFGDKIFIVEDKMHERFADTRVDIWFPDKESAKEFGIKQTIMEILE